MLERHDIAVQSLLIDPDLFVSPRHNDLVAETLPDRVNRFAEGSAGVFFVEFGPEPGDKSVPPMEALGTGDGEVREQGEALGLREDLRSIREFSATEQEKLMGGQREFD
ncbi:MAG: hypothetical protein ACO1Q7_16230 [Gemmatimonas sp.]